MTYLLAPLFWTANFRGTYRQEMNFQQTITSQPAYFFRLQTACSHAAKNEDKKRLSNTHKGEHTKHENAGLLAKYLSKTLHEGTTLALLRPSRPP